MNSNQRFAEVQEAINYEIYLREAFRGKMSGEEFSALHRELDGFDYHDLNIPKIQEIQRGLEQKRIDQDPGYAEWLREDFLANPADL
jgi:hypothetical protein